jgi:3-hydroxyisobutyrate dehydrogenase-like beta-hydroxyacid dehydrogenase
MTTIGLAHPGEMGAALGARLRERGHDVMWAAEGRSAATGDRAAAARLRDAGTLAALCAACDVLLSVCPPHAALDVARAVAGFDGVFVDANAIAPATARAVRVVVEDGGGRFVDGGIVGPPPERAGTTRLYLSGADAALVTDAFDGTCVEAPVLGPEPGTASALKMAYAAWTKGSAAMLLAIRATARASGVEDALLEEWRRSQPDVPDRLAAADESARRKGWRWVAEMEQIAATFAAAGQPHGFHRAAAEVFRSGRRRRTPPAAPRPPSAPTCTAARRAPRSARARPPAPRRRHRA